MKMDDDRKIIAVIIGLWFVQAALAVGPLRTNLEIMLVLSLVPPIDLVIEMLQLFGEGEVGTGWFYIQFFVILVKDALIAFLWKKWRK